MRRGFSGLGPRSRKVRVRPYRARAKSSRHDTPEYAGIVPNALEMGTIWAHPEVPRRQHRPSAGERPIRGLASAPDHGPVQSNGMCLLEFVVHWNLNPTASTEQTVDLPHVTSCLPGPVSQPGAFVSWGYLPGRLVGPVSAFAHALTLPAISAPQCARSGAISNVILARS